MKSSMAPLFVVTNVAAGFSLRFSAHPKGCDYIFLRILPQALACVVFMHLEELSTLIVVNSYSAVLIMSFICRIS